MCQYDLQLWLGLQSVAAQPQQDKLRSIQAGQKCLEEATIGLQCQEPAVHAKICKAELSVVPRVAVHRHLQVSALPLDVLGAFPEAGMPWELCELVEFCWLAHKRSLQQLSFDSNKASSPTNRIRHM